MTHTVVFSTDISISTLIAQIPNRHQIRGVAKRVYQNRYSSHCIYLNHSSSQLPRLTHFVFQGKVYDKGLACRCQRTFAGGLHSTFQHFRQPPQKYKAARLQYAPRERNHNRVNAQMEYCCNYNKWRMDEIWRPGWGKHTLF